jgi:magnesium chelatase subunit I
VTKLSLIAKLCGRYDYGDRGKSTTVRALVDLLPTMDVVANDPFNSHPSDPELMSEEVRKKFQAGETLETATKELL